MTEDRAALVGYWRQRADADADSADKFDRGMVYALRNCAEELEALPQPVARGDSVSAVAGGLLATQGALELLRLAEQRADAALGLLRRVVDAEFDYGDWPTEKELRDALTEEAP